MNLNMASIHLADATRYISRLTGRCLERPGALEQSWELGEAITAITKACDELGLEVVQRKQEAA